MKILSAAVLCLACLTAPSQAEEPTSGEIVRALSGEAKTRSIKGIKVEPGTNPSPPKVDLYVNFEFNSAELTNEALLSLRALGNALQDPRLKDYNFLIVGHTDAKGSDDYNLALSDKRAKAVEGHLAFYYKVDPSKISAIGRGESELLDVSAPESSLNRRVEVRNISNMSQ